ncbi:dna topoisomerase 2 [Stylonychia lemnae]|uniref:DNA topoisomerase 2 n=1 Tax=Stylonychia lemnae TaxID=5949 RepID=A0A078AUS6_STYLE|nr:dna topoisomerase 2 [Stylonychia lemnae]|eukprot:CDW84992.1 dna topoisomerase 2 [Stylonychia lemnae]
MEHILMRPDTYIGSVEYQEQLMWVYDFKNERFKEKKISYVPGLYKIFGHLLTSSNYDDSDKKVTGGRNGYGAKLANIFSKAFTVECASAKCGKKYKQVFENNLSTINSPDITTYEKSKSYTKITFEPDLKKFGMKKLEDDIVSLLAKRVYDLAGILPKSVKIQYNSKKIDFQSFEDYIKYYFKEKDLPQMFVQRFGEHWEIGVVVQDFQDQFQQVSFVNSIWTIRGGTHVNHVTDQIAQNLIEQINKKHKKIEIKPFQIKQSLWIFINSLIYNPSFDSQTKETLTLKASSFGSKCEISEKFLKQLSKCGVIESIVERAEQKETMKLKKELGTNQKKSKLFGIPKLEDANKAGTSESSKCTLILTEGDSAKSLAMSGIQVVGRDYYGVFPLKGKLINVRDIGIKQALANDEISNIIKILGLFLGTKYNNQNINTLRYGSIMIMADQDHDGSHIKGLVINFIHQLWPSLIQDVRSFVKEFVTPIIKASKDKEKHQFFTISEYEKWAQQKGQALKNYKIKYYKGLGTSTSAEAKEYFKDIANHQIKFKYLGENDDEKIKLAFGKNFSEDRKNWLANFNPNIYVDHRQKELTYGDFIDKELIHFSIADNLRSIPSLMDGLKPGQRKILFGCFKRKLKAEIKVAQLSGYIAEQTAYHHGEMSLQMTIVNMAQDFVGSNNLNLLMPIGQFGTRMMGGKDSASARYIFTNLSNLTRVLFNEQDDPLLNYQIEEGLKIEPQFYLPILPLVLINGCEGIGTGWSTYIPCYSPIDIIQNIKRKLNGKQFHRMKPWYKGFQGLIEAREQDQTQYSNYGKYEIVGSNILRITELPLRVWTREFKNHLEEMAQKQDEIKDIQENHKDNKISFEITTTSNLVLINLKHEDIEKRFKLKQNLSCNNMVLFNSQGKLQRYQNECEILDEFYNLRYELYRKRKENMLKQMNQKFEKLSNKYRFISEIIDGQLQIFKKKKDQIVQMLIDNNYKTYQQIYDLKSKINPLEATHNIQNEESGDKSGKISDKDGLKNHPYGYLLQINMYQFTQDKLLELKNQMQQQKDMLEQLNAKSIELLWLDDLDLFEKLYLKNLTDIEIQYHEEHMNSYNKNRQIFQPQQRENLSVAQNQETTLHTKVDDLMQINSERVKELMPQAVHRQVSQIEPTIKNGPKEQIIQKKQMDDDDEENITRTKQIRRFNRILNDDDENEMSIEETKEIPKQVEQKSNLSSSVKSNNKAVKEQKSDGRKRLNRSSENKNNQKRLREQKRKRKIQDSESDEEEDEDSNDSSGSEISFSNIDVSHEMAGQKRTTRLSAKKNQNESPTSKQKLTPKHIDKHRSIIDTQDNKQQAIKSSRKICDKEEIKLSEKNVDNKIVKPMTTQNNLKQGQISFIKKQVEDKFEQKQDSKLIKTSASEDQYDILTSLAKKREENLLLGRSKQKQNSYLNHSNNYIVQKLDDITEPPSLIERLNQISLQDSLKQIQEKK